MPATRVRVAIVGSGDAAHRHYLEPLRALAARAEIVGCCDRTLAKAERLAAAARGFSPDAVPFDRLDEMLGRVHPDAVFNLTPAPFHAQVTSECLAARAHVYTEKPIAASIADADRLIGEAARAGVLLMSAPASAVPRQVRWLRDVIDSGRLGRPTLVVARCASMGPADWAEYTGDPSVFYGSGVGPVFDIGIYRLHEMTALLGPVRRVAAMAAISIPERTITGGPRAGRTVTVTAPDHVLMTTEFASGALGQLLSSFAVPATQAPWLEIHLTEGSISLAGDQFAGDGAVGVFLRDGGHGREDAEFGSGPLEESILHAGGDPRGPGWHHGLTPPPPPDKFPIIGRGVEHFLACASGTERPVLTPEHARHVLEIVLLAYESIADGRARDLETTFWSEAGTPP
ncbi:MAG: Gfo/Idh/MocA family protein [Candidatus Limnocylindrales bacterium]